MGESAGQQEDERTCTPFRGACLTVSKYFLPLRQPARHEVLQHWYPSRRTVPLAMHDAHAAAVVGEAFGEEGGDMMAGLVAVHAMQVEMGLHHPTASPQIPEYPGGYAGFEPGGLVAALKRQFERVAIREGLIKRGAFIFQVLARNGGWRRRFVMESILGQRNGIVDRSLKQGARCLIERPVRHGLSEVVEILFGIQCRLTA